MKFRVKSLLSRQSMYLSRTYLAWLLILASQASHAQTPPPNDDFTNRIVIAGTSAVMEGTLSGSTLETNEPMHWTNATGGSVWWTWTAPADGVVEIADLPGFAYSLAGIVAVYTGDSLDSLEQVTVSYLPTFFTATAGTAYQIAVLGAGPDDTRQVELELNLYDSPTNYSFDSRSPLTTGETNNSCSYFDTLAQRPLWWTWTAPTHGLVDLQWFGDTRVQLFTGTGPTNLVPLAESSAPFGVSGYEVQAGEVLQIEAEEDPEPFEPISGHTEFALIFTPAAANDDFTNRIVLSGLPVQVSGDNTFATAEPGEPAHMGQPPSHTVWYQWTAPQSGPIGVLLDASWQTAYQTPVVSVYTGNSLTNLVLIAGKSLSTEPVTFHATAGRTYCIVVGTTGGDGPFQLAIVGPPANDNFDSATELTGWNAESNSWTTCATMQPGEQPLTKYDSHQSIWWTWQAPYSGWVDLSLVASYPVPLGVFTGNTLGGLHFVPFENFNPTFGLTTESFQATAGTVYHIRATGVRFVQNRKLVTMNGPIDLSLVLDTMQASVSGGSLTFVGPQDVTIQAQTNGQQFGDPVVLTFTAVDAPDYDPISGTISGPPWQYTFTNLPCGLYQVTVSGTNAEGASVFASPLTVRVTPQNDDFANRIPLPPTPGGPSGSFAGATLEPGEPRLKSSDTASTWFYWTPSNTAPFEVTLYSGSLQIFDGDSLASLHLLKSATNGSFQFNAVSNHTYQLRCSTTSDPENSSYTAIFAQKYTNDNFADRILLIGTNVTFIADNSAATTQPGEPPPDKPSLWWTWTSPGDGYLLVTSSNMDPYLPVYFDLYTGTEFKTMQIVYAETNGAQPPGSGLFRVHAGTNYQISAEAEMPLADMLVSFNLQFVPLSTNDNFADRIQISDTNLVFGGENYSATLESNEPPESVGSDAGRTLGGPRTPVEATLWWEWTATTNGTATINYLGGSLQPFVAIYQGTNLATLSNLDNTLWDIVPTSYTFSVQAGQTYEISAGGVGSARGQFVLQLIP